MEPTLVFIKGGMDTEWSCTVCKEMDTTGDNPNKPIKPHGFFCNLKIAIQTIILKRKNKGSKHKTPHWTSSDDWWTGCKILNIIPHLELQWEQRWGVSSLCIYPVMALTESTDHRNGDEYVTSTFIHCWWKCQMEQLLQKTVGQYLQDQLSLIIISGIVLGIDTESCWYPSSQTLACKYHSLHYAVQLFSWRLIHSILKGRALTQKGNNSKQFQEILETEQT